MIVDGRNISGAPTLMPLIICSSVPSWLEWKTRISTLPLRASLTFFAYSAATMSNSEPGNPTCPSRITCWAAARSGRASGRSRTAGKTATMRRAMRSIRPEPHHVTRDVQAEASRGGVAGEGDALGGLRLDVAGAVGGVAQIRAPARAGHRGRPVALGGDEAVELRHLGLGGEDGPPPPRDRLHPIADAVDGHRARAIAAQPPGPGTERDPRRQESPHDGPPRHARRLRGTSRLPTRSVPSPVRSS